MAISKSFEPTAYFDDVIDAEDLLLDGGIMSKNPVVFQLFK